MRAIVMTTLVASGTLAYADAEKPSAQTTKTQVSFVWLESGQPINRAVLFGPSGQVYWPSATEWVRRDAGGAAIRLQGAIVRPGKVLVVGDRTPLFERTGKEMFKRVRLTNRGRTTVSVGPSVLVGVHRHLYRHNGSKWLRMNSLQSAVTSLYAKGTSYVAALQNRTLWKGRGGGARSIRVPTGTAPVDALRVFGDDRVILVTASSVTGDVHYQLQGNTLRRIDSSALTNGSALGVWDGKVLSTRGDKVQLWTLQGRKLTTPELIFTLANKERVTAWRGDHQGGILLALSSGRVLYRSGPSAPMVVATIKTDLPPAQGVGTGAATTP